MTAQDSKGLAVLIGLVTLIIVGVSLKHTSSTPTAAPAPTPAAAPPAMNDAPTQPPSLCDSQYSFPSSHVGGPYDGTVGCWPGEAVTVAQILDAGTFVLTDGRRVRLAGVAVAGSRSCGGPAALAETRSQFHEGQQVNMLHEPDGGADPFGSQWVYIAGDQGYWANDLGSHLASAGYAEPLPNSGANPVYMDGVTTIVELSKTIHNGQWGPPCGPSEDTSPAPSRTSASSGHVHVDDHHRNMRDGALTGGFCAHHWWC